jgi:integrase
VGPALAQRPARVRENIVGHWQTDLGSIVLKSDGTYEGEVIEYATGRRQKFSGRYTYRNGRLELGGERAHVRWHSEVIGDTRYTSGKRLRQALKVAQQMGYVRKNVAKDVPLPRPVRREIHPLTTEEVRSLLEPSEGTRYHALYVVALDSGAREGELLALSWEDWNPVTRELTIAKSLTQTKECKLVVKEPKTKASRRKIVLSEESAQALEAHRDRQRAKGLQTKVVFAAANGGYTFRHNLIKYAFRPALKKAGLPVSVRFHDLRHTCATFLLASGQVDPKTVAERLGHSSTQRLFDTYAHVLPSMRPKAAQVMGSLLGGSKVAVNGAG